MMRRETDLAPERTPIATCRYAGKVVRRRPDFVAGAFCVYIRSGRAIDRRGSPMSGMLSLAWGRPPGVLGSRCQGSADETDDQCCQTGRRGMDRRCRRATDRRAASSQRQSWWQRSCCAVHVWHGNMGPIGRGRWPAFLSAGAIRCGGERCRASARRIVVRAVGAALYRIGVGCQSACLRGCSASGWQHRRTGVRGGRAPSGRAFARALTAEGRRAHPPRDGCGDAE